MKSKLIDEIKELFTQSVNWAKLEVEYLRLTAAEKLIILSGALILGAVFMLLLLPVVLMFLLALVSVFRNFMPGYAAYLSVGGIVLVCLGIIFLFRKQIIINPVAKFISKLFLDKNHQSH